MTADRKEGNGWTKAMRGLARLLALIAGGLMILFVVETGPKALAELPWGSPQGMPLLLGVLVALVGVLLAWRWELIGGVMAVGGAVAVMALACAGSGFQLFRCALLFTAPFLMAGALYLGCCWRKRTTGFSNLSYVPGTPGQSSWHR
ncbi:hypothetical protein ACFLTC_03140 [Chloroflexota bacterium]